MRSVASSSFIHVYGERTSDFVCTSTLNPSILVLFKQQAKGYKRIKFNGGEKNY